MADSLLTKFEDETMDGPSDLAKAAKNFEDGVVTNDESYNKSTFATSLPGTAHHPGLGQPEDSSALGLDDGSGTGVNGVSIYSFDNKQLDNIDKNTYHNNDIYTKQNITNP